jgi:hypothetical protein
MSCTGIKPFFSSLRRTDLQNINKKAVLSTEIYFSRPGDDTDCGCVSEVLRAILEGKTAGRAYWEIIIYKAEVRNV